jgi:hypothetical protein
VTDSAKTDQPPRFDRRIHVGHVDGSGGIGGMLVASAIGSLPGLGLFATMRNADPAQSSWWHSVATTLGVIGAVVLALIGVCVGLFVYYLLEQRWMTWRGKRSFTGDTRVRVDEDGLLIEALGLNVWAEVLGWEGVPDSDHYLVVHTQRFGSMLLSAPVAPLVKALAHHQAAARIKAVADASDVFGQPDFDFTALVFSWPRFRTWIWAGYLLAVALALALLSGAADHGAFKTLVGIALACPLVAWLVWMIPMSRFGVLAGRALRAFRLKGHRLETRDGWQADLHQSRVIVQARAGIGYDLSFITIVPHDGRRQDVVVAEPERSALIAQMQAAGVQLQERRSPGLIPDARVPNDDLERHAREVRGAAPIWRDD